MRPLRQIESLGLTIIEVLASSQPPEDRIRYAHRAVEQIVDLAPQHGRPRLTQSQREQQAREYANEIVTAAAGVLEGGDRLSLERVAERLF